MYLLNAYVCLNKILIWQLKVFLLLVLVLQILGFSI